MTEAETRMLLAQVSALDNRKITNAMITMWFGLFQRYTYAEVKWALYNHASESTEYIMPAHLIQIVNGKRADFAASNPTRARDDSWLDEEYQIELAAAECRERRASGARYAVEAIDAMEVEGGD